MNGALLDPIKCSWPFMSGLLAEQLVQQNGHLLHLDISHPTKGLHVQFSYGDCGIRYINVLDYIAGARRPQIAQLPASDPTPSVEVNFDGWVFPKGGVAFVWVLKSEIQS